MIQKITNSPHLNLWVFTNNPEFTDDQQKNAWFEWTNLCYAYFKRTVYQYNKQANKYKSNQNPIPSHPATRPAAPLENGFGKLKLNPFPMLDEKVWR